MNRKSIIFFVFCTIILISFLFTSSVLPDPDNIINILDHGSDTREIWLGVEDYQTGKKVDPKSPDIWFIFDQPVDTDLIRDALRIESDDSESKCELGTLSFPEIPVFPIAIENVVNAWEMGTVGSTGQVYPRDFNAFIFNDITGIPHSEGPLAAGNNIATQDFGINQMTTEQTALVAGNELELLNGEVNGDTYTGEYYEQPQSVTIHGNKTQGYPIAFKSAVTALCLFSRYLANEYTANAYITSQWGNTYFKGSNETINVFDINTEDLTGANYIEINVPYDSIVLINVEGENFSLGNLGINVTGTDKQHVLWNFENAKDISLSSISFPGSVLAPFAKVELNNGNLEGTVVAADLTGTGELHYFPFKDWEKFDIDNRVYIRPVRKLAYDCEYRLVIENYALNQDGGCLGEKLEIPFKTIEKQESNTAFHRETETVLWDYHNNRLNSFTIKDGINTQTEKMFERYANIMNLRPQDTLKLAAEPKHTAADPNQDWTYYAQYFRNIRVDGFGYTVYEENGFSRSVFGRLINELEVDTSANISQDDAVYTACASMNIWQPYPWQNDPDQYQEPDCELVIASIKDHAEAEDFKLMWRIDCGQSNLENAELFYIDAVNNQVIYRQDKERRLGSSQPIDDMEYSGPGLAYLNINLELDGQSTVSYPSIPSDLYRMENSGTSTDYYALAMTKDSSYNDYTAQFNLKIQVGDPEETPELLICNDIDTWYLSANIPDSDAADPYFYPALGMWQILLTSEFYALSHKDPVTDEPWQGIDGTGEGNFLYVFTPPLPPDTKKEDLYLSRYFFDPVNPKIEIPYDLTIADSKKAYIIIGTIPHEMTHGVFEVTRRRAGGEEFRIAYTGEGGTINEGLAEIMNYIILDQGYNIMNKPMKTLTYLMFEDISSYQCPTYYKGEYWLEPTETHPELKWDYLHTNCTVLWHWFNLLYQGGSGINEGGYKYEITPIGLNEDDSLIKLARILLLATTELLPAGNPTFTELRNATILAAYRYYEEDADFQDMIKNIKTAWNAVGVYGEVPQIKADSIFPAEQDEVYPWPVHFGCEFESEVDPEDLWLLEIAEKYFKDEDFEDSDIIFSKNITAVDLQEPLTTEDREVKYYLKPYTQYFWRLRPLEYDSVLEDYTVLHNVQVNSFTTNLNDFALKEEAYKTQPYKEKQYNQIIEEKTTGFEYDFAMLPLKYAGDPGKQVFSLEGGEIPGAFYAEFTSSDVEITTEKVYEENFPGTDFNNRFILEFDSSAAAHLTMCRVDITTGCDETSDPAVIDPSYLEYDYSFYFMVFDPELYSPLDPDGLYEEVGNYYFDQFAEDADEKPYFTWNHLKGEYVPDMEYQLIIYPFSYVDDAIFNDVVDYKVETQTINGYQLAGYQFADQTANEKAVTHSCKILYLNSNNMVPLNYYAVPKSMYGIKMVAPEISYPVDNETIDFLAPVVDVTFKQIPGVVTVNDTVSSPGGLKQLNPDYFVKIWERDSEGNKTGDPEAFKLLADSSEYYHQDGDDVTLSIEMGDNPHGYVVQLQAHHIYCPLGEPAEFTFNWKLPAPNLIFPDEGETRYPFGTDEVIFYWNNDYELDGTTYGNTPASAYLFGLFTSGTLVGSAVLHTGDFDYDETSRLCSVSSKKFMPDDYVFDYKNPYTYRMAAINADGISSETSEKKFELEFTPIQILDIEEDGEYIAVTWYCEFMQENGGYQLAIYNSDGDLKYEWGNNGYYAGTHTTTINRGDYHFRNFGNYDFHFVTLRDGNRVQETVQTFYLKYAMDPNSSSSSSSSSSSGGGCTPVTDAPDLIGPGIDSYWLFDKLDENYTPDATVEWSEWESLVPVGYYAMWDAVESATEYEIKVVGIRETRDVWEYYYDMIVTQTPPAFTDSMIVDANDQDEFNVNIRDLLTAQTDGVSNYLFLVVVDAYNDCTSEHVTSNVRVTRTDL